MTCRHVTYSPELSLSLSLSLSLFLPLSLLYSVPLWIHPAPQTINILLNFAPFPHPKNNYVPSPHQPRRVSDPVQLTRQFKCHKRSKTKSPVSAFACQFTISNQSSLFYYPFAAPPPSFLLPFPLLLSYPLVAIAIAVAVTVLIALALLAAAVACCACACTS